MWLPARGCDLAARLLRRSVEILISNSTCVRSHKLYTQWERVYFKLLILIHRRAHVEPHRRELPSNLRIMGILSWHRDQRKRNAFLGIHVIPVAVVADHVLFLSLLGQEDIFQ